MAAEDLEITKDGPSANPWRLTVAKGPAAGTVVHFGAKTKRDAQALLDAVAHLPWANLQPTVEAWLDSTPAPPDAIVTVRSYELAMLVDRLERAERAEAAWKRLGLFIDLHSDVTQAKLREALERSMASTAGDPWNDPEEATHGPS